MKKRSRIAVLSVVLLVALAVNGAFPQPAMADDVPPPPPDTAEPAPTEPPVESPTEEAPTVEAAPTEAAPAAPTEETDPSQVIASLPPDTGLVVLDANGQPMSLTTTEAALAIATGDPMWCPSGSSPGDSDCVSSGTFNGAGGLLDLLDNDTTLYSGAGTIYIAYNYTTLGEGTIVIDGSMYGLTDLTVQGGWDFGIPNEVVGTTTFEEALQIINWGNDVTLNDLVFNGPNGAQSLLVQADGDIELNNVEVKGNTSGDGADLDNTSGSGTIQVNNSSFHDNLTIGIQALSNNSISLTTVDAYDNGASGAVLDNCQAAVSCTATFAGGVTVWTSSFNDNGGNGLDVSSNGAILTVDLQANGNALSGAVLDNSLADDPQSATVGYLYGNEFNDNYDNGLTVLSQGDITLYQVTANNNGHASSWASAGAYLDNTYGNANTFVYNYNIYTDAYGEFSGNYADGLDVLSNGNVELWYVIAEDNGNTGNASPLWGIGTFIDNCNSNGLSCDGTGWVEVNDSQFNDNFSDGLDVISAGAIELNDVVADNNGNTGNTNSAYGVGAYLDNSGGTAGVTIDGGEFGNFVSGGNYGNGLQVYSTGDIYVSYVFAEDNGLTGNANTAFGNGAILDSCLENAGSCAGSGYVYVLASEFNDNYADGLQAFSSDNIWLNYYVSAEGNGQSMSLGSGAMLVNNFNGATGSILMYGPITLNNNYDSGLTAESNGDVYMTGVDASLNGDAGATVTTTNGSVTIDLGTFNSNDAQGLDVNAADDVLLTGVLANNNGTFGASLGTSGGDVTVGTSSFNSNDTGLGLEIGAAGDVSLDQVEALANATFGASIANGGGTSVTDGFFNGNLGDFGLNITSSDDVALSGVEANSNASYGAGISNGGDTTIETSSFNGNLGDFGLDVSSAGDISLSEVEANSNSTYGAELDNGADTSVETGFFNGNLGDFGLDISSGGDVSLADVEANSNATYGASIGNAGDTTIQTGSFNDNMSDFGLDISSGGNVLLNHVSADDNATYGADISNGGDVTIDNSSFSGNTADHGLDVSSSGDVSLASIGANNNGDFGAQIANGGGTTIVSGFFDGNLGAYGLNVSSLADVALTDVSASNNATYGADLSSGIGGVSVQGGTFDDNNGGGGLDVTAFGETHLTDVSASHNSTYGADILGNGNVFVDGSFDWNTGSFGLNVSGNHNVTLGEVSAVHNGGDGASISSGGAVSVDPSLFEWNSGHGLSIASTGGVVLGSIAANHNTSTGVSATTAGNFEAVTSSMASNGGTGLNVLAGGSVYLAEIYASDNGGDGATVTAGGDVNVKQGMFSNNAGDGLNITSGGNAMLKCTVATGNGGFGLDANLPGVLTTKGMTVHDNTAGDFNLTGGGTRLDLFAGCEGWPHWDSSGLPWQVFHVNTGDSHALECTQFGGTVLILPSWDHVAIPCPIAGDASLTAIAGDHLPGPLGDNYTYVSGLEAQVKPSLDGEIRVDFLVPPAYLGTHLIILHWDGSQWVDRGGTQTSDNFFETTSREGGTYLLVSQ